MENITLRPAKITDADMVFEWRNTFETRQYFFDPRPLVKKDHINWFELSLTMSNRCLLIAELDTIPIGVLRYDLMDDRGEIDIYLNPLCVGKGLGTLMLNEGTDWLQKNFPNIKTLVAHIIPNNIASLKAFEKAGFYAKMHVYEKNIGIR